MRDAGNSLKCKIYQCYKNLSRAGPATLTVITDCLCVTIGVPCKGVPYLDSRRK